MRHAARGGIQPDHGTVVAESDTFCAMNGSATMATDPQTGLTNEEAARRRAAGQGNDVEISTGRSYGRIVRDNVFNFINNLFYLLGIVLLVLGKPLDAVVVSFVIFANTVVSLSQELRAKRIIDRISILTRPKAAVLRGGTLQSLDPAQIVVGDVLAVHPGDQVVVDGVMMDEGRIEVDESLLTGESDLVRKHPGDELLSGSFCVTGVATYEATRVGLESFANKLTVKAKGFKRELTPLQRQVNQIVRVLLVVVVIFEILVWVRNVAVDIPFVQSVRMSTVILALIPNGLVLSIALAYALGTVRLLGRDMLVQQANAVESLSNVDVLCTDKTGTLTSGVVKTHEVLALGADRQRAERLLGTFAASTTDANRTIEALRDALPAQRLAPQHEAFFSSARKWSGLAFDDGDARGTYVLGAPEMLAPALGEGSGRGEPDANAPDWRAQADAWALEGLRVVLFAARPEALAFSEQDRPPELPADLQALALVSFSDELRPGVRSTLDEFAASGIEVKIISGDNPRTVQALATQAGVHTLHLREGVDAYCEVVLDQSGAPSTADAPAGAPATTSADLPAGPDEPAAAAARPYADLTAVSGAELQAMSAEEFAATAERATIFGRVTPEQKEDLLQALRARGRYAAMIGDGVNDVIALKQANVAVAMQGGSQAARGVADLVLLNDTFAPLPYAFREGQRIINGMNDILRIFMVRIFYKALLIAAITALGGFPFAPRQASLISFVTVGVPAAAFALWARPGPTPKVSLFKLLARFVVPTTILQLIMSVPVYLAWALPAKHSYLLAHPHAGDTQLMEFAYAQAQTALTLFASFCGILLIVLAVPPTRYWAAGAVYRGDHRIAGVAAAMLAFVAGAIVLPFGRTLFELSSLPVWQYFALFAAAVVWSQLCLLVWRTGVLDRWFGTATDPGNVCAEREAAGPALLRP
jgi:cation-transporting P-type ATPase E